MRIWFGSKKGGSTLWIAVDTELDLEKKIIWLQWDAGGEIQANVLATRFGEMLGDRLSEIRQQEYEAGWKDRGAKKKRRDFFFKTLALLPEYLKGGKK